MNQQRYGLSHLGATYKAADVAKNYATIPDGLYHGKINCAEVRKSYNGGLYISWELLVSMDGTPGSVLCVQKISTLSEKAMPNLKGDLKAVGVDPDALDPFDRLYDVLEYLEGAIVEFEQVSRENENNPSKPYRNQNFQRIVTPSGKPAPDFSAQLPASAEGVVPSSDDKLPWES